MAKKKKSKRRKPPRGPRPAGERQAATAAPSAAEVRAPDDGAPQKVSKARERRLRAEELRRQRERRRRIRTIGIVAVAVVAVVAAVGARIVMNRSAAAQFNEIAAAGGCGDVRSFDATGSGQHLPEGQTTTYDTSPPTSGPHDAQTMKERVLRPTDVLSMDRNAPGPTIYQAVHSLEHGAVIVWYKGISDEEFDDLDRAVRDERKVIAAPYEDLEDGKKVALTVWGKMLTCDRLDVEVVDAFIERFREKTAPENTVDL